MGDQRVGNRGIATVWHREEDFAIIERLFGWGDLYDDRRKLSGVRTKTNVA